MSLGRSLTDLYVILQNGRHRTTHLETLADVVANDAKRE